jgi:hypothetical protein
MVHSDVVGTPIFVSFPPVRLMKAPRSITSLNGMIQNNPGIFIEMHSVLLLFPSHRLLLLRQILGLDISFRAQI